MQKDPILVRRAKAKDVCAEVKAIILPEVSSQ